jgi:hypothetical protein
MPGQRPVVGKNAVVTDDAIMSHMGIGQKMVPASDDRFLVWAGAAVHGNKLPEIIFIPHLQIGWFPLVFQVLGPPPDGAKGVKEILFSKPTGALEVHMVSQDATLPEFHPLPDHTVRAHLHGRGQLGLGMNDCR